MTREEQIEAIEELADTIEGEVRSDYSGRGMYGELCYGIVCRNETRCLEEAGALGLRGAKVDNMGLDMIVYWPRIKGERSASDATETA